MFVHLGSIISTVPGEPRGPPRGAYIFFTLPFAAESKIDIVGGLAAAAASLSLVYISAATGGAAPSPEV